MSSSWAKRNVFRFEFNAENLFNQKTAEYIYNFYNRFRTAEFAHQPAQREPHSRATTTIALIAATPDATSGRRAPRTRASASKITSAPASSAGSA